MPKGTQLAFNGGEFTEFMDPRVDVQKYSKGCRTLENMYPLPYGSVLARPGTIHGGKTKYADKDTRLVPFAFSKTTTLDIETGHEYMRFWVDRQPVMDGLSPYEIATPYQEEDIRELQIEQTNDVVYIVHPSYRLHRLTRLANDDWTIAPVNFTDNYGFPPLKALNIDESKTLEVTAGNHDVVGDTVTVVSSFDKFSPDSVGELISISHDREVADEKYTVSAVGTSAPIQVLGDWVFQTQGTGNIDVRLEESQDKTTWKTKYSYSEVNGTERNVLNTGTQQEPAWFRINVTKVTSGGTDVVIEVANPTVKGLLRITSYTSATAVQCEVVEPLHEATASHHWQDEYFNSADGYARALSIHKDRLCLASSGVWLSQPGNYENFRTRNDADSGFLVPITRNGSPQVNWLESLRQLRVGTNQAEAIIHAENDNEVFAYNNFAVRWDSNFGSKYLRAEPVNGTVFFLQQEGRTLRSQIITGIEQFYDANSLTALADHILGEGVIQTAYQRQRYPTFHGIRKDGQMASLVYEASQNVQAWYRTVTDGEIKSVSVTPQPDEEDNVALIVKREVDGAMEQHVEFVASGQYRILQNDDVDNMWFVDDGVKVTGSGITTVTGLEHMEGASVAILADGAEQTERVVSNGEIELDYPADTVIVGRPYDMTLIPMFLESQQIMGRSKNISAAIVRLWRSGRARVRVNDGRYSRLSLPVDTFNEAPSLQTGDAEKVTVGSEWDRNTAIEIKGRSPMPLNVQAITLEFEVGRG